MKTKEYIRRGTLISLAFAQFLLFPAYSSTGNVVWAEGTPEETTQITNQETTATETPSGSTETSEPTPPPPPPKAGPRPNGADSNVFTYDYNTDTWESFLYSYDPVTRVRTKKNVPTVRYNYDTGKWEKLAWSFSAPSQTYFWYVVSEHDTRPSGVVMGNVPNYTEQDRRDGNCNSSCSGGGSGGTSINGTGPNSNTGVNNNTNNNTDLNFNNNANFNIYLDLLAASGNAGVLGNTTGGSASSGNADSTANVLNQIQSQWDISDILTFNSDLYGDIYGDLLVNTQNIGPKANVDVDNNVNNNLDIDVNNNTNIVNDIDVVAQTGDATVSGNTNGGDATTGDANAMVNIINMINSSINSGATFMGTLNIHGNFDGDILFPDGALNTLISNTGPKSDVSVDSNVNNNLDAEINNNTNIKNNISATATSGDALVTGNTNAGDATSGNATSSVTMLNLTGKDVVSENTLLVFINVLGEWMGVLMDAPGGTTAAAIGGGANVDVDNNVNNNIEYTENNNANITNNVNVTAQSGDATVKGNTNAGDATTGDANAAVNVANLVGSDITSSSWFGVLFINVFGTWAGSFGVDTEAGDHRNNGAVAGASTDRGGQGGDGPLSPRKPISPRASISPSNGDVKVYGFTSNGDGGHTAVAINGGQGGDGTVAGITDENDPSVLGINDAVSGALQQTGDSSAQFNIPVGAALILLSAAFVLGPRVLNFARRRT